MEDIAVNLEGKIYFGKAHNKSGTVGGRAKMAEE